MMKTIDLIKQLAYSLKLAQLGARPPVITSLTGLKTQQAIKIYREVHGGVPKGPLHHTVDWIFRSRKKNRICTELLQAYLQAREAKENHIQALIVAYESIAANGDISFDQAWQIARETLAGTINLVQCGCCDNGYLIHWLELQNDLHCPWCSGNSKEVSTQSSIPTVNLPPVAMRCSHRLNASNGQRLP